MKIVVTGGHLTPALAFIDYVQQHDSEAEFVFFGRKYSQTGNKQLAREAVEAKKRKIPFFEIDAPRSKRKNPFALLRQLLFYPVTVVRSIILLLKVSPDVFVSFGGYLAVPVALASWILRVPIITHEQTKTAGSANMFIAKLAKKVAVSFTSSKQYFPKNKTVVTGNPIRQQILKEKPPRPNWIETTQLKPILYITGGNQGSYILNTTVMQILPQLTRKYTVIHTCGKATNTSNYKKELTAARKQLSPAARSNYYVREWISAEELAWVLSHADLSISRSGANTVLEMVLKQVPTLFIPLPFSKNNEQFLNAEFVQKKGGALILQQKDLNPQSLLKALTTMNKKKTTFKKNLKSISILQDGDEQLYQLVFKTLQK